MNGNIRFTAQEKTDNAAIGYDWPHLVSDQCEAPQSSLCAKDPTILPAEAMELSRASASDLDN